MPRVRHIHIKRGEKSRKTDKSSCRRLDSSQEHDVAEQTMVAKETTAQTPARLLSRAELASMLAAQAEAPQGPGCCPPSSGTAGPQTNGF